MDDNIKIDIKLCNISKIKNNSENIKIDIKLGG